jgi:hypothetical protein
MTDLAITEAAKACVQRAMSCGLTREQAWEAVIKIVLKESDRIARERRSRFKIVK